jgi:hypothetical protein
LAFCAINHYGAIGPDARRDQSGGEVHTFTHVAAFGGGIVPLLNDLAGVPNVAPECTSLAQGDFVTPGTTYEEDIVDPGTQRFQCCIHPWMRLEVQGPNR